MAIAILGKNYGLGNPTSKSDIMQTVTNVAFPASNYGEAEYIKVLSVIGPQYQAWFKAQSDHAADSITNAAKVPELQRLADLNFPGKFIIKREISWQSRGTNIPVISLYYYNMGTPIKEFDESQSVNTIWINMQPLMSSYATPTPLATNNISNSSPVNNANSITSQVSTNSATTSNNFVTSGANPTNNIASNTNVNTTGNTRDGVFSWVSYGGPSPMTVWTPTGPKTTITENPFISWVKTNPILAVGITGLSFFVLKGFKQ